MAMFQVTADGVDVTTKIVSYDRTKNICSGTGGLNLEVEYKTGYEGLPWDRIILWEEGRRKGTYYVSSIEKGATTGTKKVICVDGSKRITEYFIPDIYNINYQSYARYWIEKFLTEAGVTYSIDTDSQGALLSENFALGPSMAFDIIQSLLQNSGWYMYFNASDVCHIGPLNVDLTGPVKATIRANTIVSMSLDKNDAMLRNRAVVWGNYDPDSGVWVYADVTQHTPWDRNENDIRTVLLSNSMVRNNGTAYALATRMLQEFTKITYEKSLEVAGEVNLELGDIVKVNTKWHKGECLVTTIGSRCSKNGLITTMILDQRCPRLFGYTSYLDYVYVGTNGAGVWRKPLDSNAWESFSTGLIGFDTTDLIIKNGIFACVSTGVAYINTEHIADWQIYDPINFLDLNNQTYPTGQFQAVAVDIDDYTNNILIGYRLLDGIAALVGEQRSWIVEVTPDMELVSKRQVYIIDADHQDFKLIDVDKYAAKRLCTAEAPTAYAPEDPQFWGDRKVYKIYDPEPKAKVYGPPPECEYIDDPFHTQEELYLGAYYEDSTSIIEGDAISSFWSNGWWTQFTYDYFLDDTRYNVTHPIEWPISYGSPFGEDNYLFARIVYRKSFTALSEATEDEDRMYHVCDMVKTGTELNLYHHKISPLVYGYTYQIQNADVATTENIPLYGLQTIDGISVQAGWRVLVKDQTDPKQNGVYYSSETDWTRTVDIVPTENLQNGMLVSIALGTTNRWTAWQVSADDYVDIGVDDINFVQVLEILSSSSIAIGSTTEFHAELPAGVYYTTNVERIPKMREEVIYYVYDGHINANDNPENPFSGSGQHIFIIFKYNILDGVSKKEELYKYDYTTNFGDYVTREPEYRTTNVTELIPAGTGVGMFFFLFRKYPLWEAAAYIGNSIINWGSNNTSLNGIWVVPDGYAPGTGCQPSIDYVAIDSNKTAWCGTLMAGENPDIASFLKFHAAFGYETLYPCCLVPPGRDAFGWVETQVTGIIELGSGGIIASWTGYRGWNIEDCAKQYLPDSFKYAEYSHDYTIIEPLYIRDAIPYYRYGATAIYSSVSFADAGVVGYLSHSGLMSPHMDDFDQSIYIYSHPLIYKESIDGTTLATLNAELLYTPIAMYTKFLVTNGYFILMSEGYKRQIDASFYGKLKNEYLFYGKDFCYLMLERNIEDSIRGLDYEIKDHDFYDLALENSQEFPLVSWTTGNSLITYSGCNGVIYSGGNPHLKWYNVELNETTIAGEFNDTRIFTIANGFITEDGTIDGYGKYIGVTWSGMPLLSMLPSNSISSDDFINIYTCSGISGKLETSNSPYPYLFVSTSGVGFFQRDPAASGFVDYSPGGLFGEINVIRIDDRV